MSKFSQDFLNYCNYINNNGSDEDYTDNCKKYRSQFIAALSFAEPKELASLAKDYQFIIHMEDGFELYKRYFELGGREKEVLNDFLEFLWFWGDFDDVIPALTEIIESENNNSLEDIIKVIIRGGLAGLDKLIETQ